jgi:hypothetical protein
MNCLGVFRVCRVLDFLCLCSNSTRFLLCGPMVSEATPFVISIPRSKASRSFLCLTYFANHNLFLNYKLAPYYCIMGVLSTCPEWSGRSCSFKLYMYVGVLLGVEILGFKTHIENSREPPITIFTSMKTCLGSTWRKTSIFQARSYNPLIHCRSSGTRKTSRWLLCTLLGSSSDALPIDCSC